MMIGVSVRNMESADTQRVNLLRGRTYAVSVSWVHTVIPYYSYYHGLAARVVRDAPSPPPLPEHFKTNSAQAFLLVLLTVRFLSAFHFRLFY